MKEVLLLLVGAIGGAGVYRLATRLSEFCNQVDEGHRVTGPVSEIFTSPEAIDSAKKWTAAKSTQPADVQHAALILEVLYQWQLKFIKKDPAECPNSN